MAFATRARGVDPGPATMDLGEEPPAVVDLLANDWRVTPDAIPATLLDLAARDYVDLEQHGPGRTVCRVRRASGEGLETYERMVLDQVAGLAVGGGVPAEALTTGPQDQSRSWWRAFQRAVVDDAHQRGLVRDRWSAPAKTFLRAAALVPAGLGVLYANAAGGLDFGTVGAGLVIWAVLHALPMGAEDDHRAWSAYGGRWRVVKVGYRRLGFTWGRRPPLAFLVGLAMVGAGYVVLRLMLGLRGWTEGYTGTAPAAGWVRTASTVVALAALVVAAWGAWTMLRAVLDLVSRREVEGQVVRRRSYSRGNDRTDHFMAVDSGRSDKVRAWLVPAAVYGRFREGVVVWATIGPRLGHVFRIEPISEGRAAASATGTAPAAPAATGTSRASGPAAPAWTDGAGGDAGQGAVAWTGGLAGILADPGIEVDPAQVVSGKDAALALGEAVDPAQVVSGEDAALALGEAVDPAQVVSGEDAALALGEAVDPARPLFQQALPVGGMRGCRYQASSGRASVSVFTAAGDLVRLLARVNRRFGDTVEGIGDEAFLRGDTIAVIRGDIAVSIRLQSDQVADPSAALRRLAATAAGRLARPFSQAPASPDPV